jgi:hypothetical protein
MRLGRLDDRNVQRFWSAAAQARSDCDAGGAPANDQDLMMLGVGHGTVPLLSLDFIYPAFAHIHAAMSMQCSSASRSGSPS